jgi:hypothetical protein
MNTHDLFVWDSRLRDGEHRFILGSKHHGRWPVISNLRGYLFFKLAQDVRDSGGAVVSFNVTRSTNMDSLRGKKFGGSGTKNPMSKLHEEDIDEIFTLRENGMMMKDIAILKQVSRQQISKILHGECWGKKGRGN